MVTGAGGLALLAGVLLLGHVVGSYELTQVLASGALIKAHPLYELILVRCCWVRSPSPRSFRSTSGCARNGRADAGQRLPALRDHGQGGHLPAGPAVPGTRRH